MIKPVLRKKTTRNIISIFATEEIIPVNADKGIGNLSVIAFPSPRVIAFTAIFVRAYRSKIRKYVDFLKDNKEFKTKFYDIGDGLSVTYRNEK